MTKTAAVMLVLTCAVVALPQKADANIWGALVSLTQPAPKQLYVINHTGRPVRVRVWTNQGDQVKFRFDDQSAIGVSSDATWFSCEATVWNKNTRKCVVMDYAECPRGSVFEFYKHAQGNFGLRLW